MAQARPLTLELLEDRTAPAAFGTALCALDLDLGPARELAVVGRPEVRGPLLEVAWRKFRPRLVVAAGDPGWATTYAPWSASGSSTVPSR